MYIDLLNNLSKKIIGSPKIWELPDSLTLTMEEDFKRCIHKAKNEEGVIEALESMIDPVRPPSETADINLEVLKQWQNEPESSPSMPGLGLFAIQYFKINNKHCITGILAACLIAEIENKQPYHNNMHFKKVVIQALRLIAMHNHIHSDDANKLNECEMSLLIIGAAIHDFGHNGKGDNMAQGIHYPAVLEERSLKYARVFLEEIGFSDKGDYKTLLAMICSTDISESEKNPKFSSIMKAAYKAHYCDEEMPELPNKLSGLRDKRVALLSCLLQEADIATSAGIDYRLSQFEGRLVALEAGIHVIATPGGLSAFLKNICDSAMLSDAGQALYSERLQSILAVAEADSEDGNEPFPRLDKSWIMNS